MGDDIELIEKPEAIVAAHKAGIADDRHKQSAKHEGLQTTLATLQRELQDPTSIDHLMQIAGYSGKIAVGHYMRTRPYSWNEPQPQCVEYDAPSPHGK